MRRQSSRLRSPIPNPTYWNLVGSIARCLGRVCQCPESHFTFPGCIAHGSRQGGDEEVEIGIPRDIAGRHARTSGRWRAVDARKHPCNEGGSVLQIVGHMDIVSCRTTIVGHRNGVLHRIAWRSILRSLRFIHKKLIDHRHRRTLGLTNDARLRRNLHCPCWNGVGESQRRVITGRSRETHGNNAGSTSGNAVATRSKARSRSRCTAAAAIANARRRELLATDQIADIRFVELADGQGVRGIVVQGNDPSARFPTGDTRGSWRLAHAQRRANRDIGSGIRRRF